MRFICINLIVSLLVLTRCGAAGGPDGAQILYDSGYMTGGPKFFEKIEAEGGSRGSQLFSDHPNSGTK